MRVGVGLVFYTYIKHNNKNYKVMIDGDSCVNIITKTAVERINLKIEPHSPPYNIAWVDKTDQSVIQCCLVLIQFSIY